MPWNIVWAIVRTVLGIYLLIGFVVYLMRAKAIEEEARAQAARGQKKLWLLFGRKIAGAILLWPMVLATGQYKQ
ncbi:MAG: hypothetical protein HFE85_04605 [Clostridiales bacterium]|nr:hypothetical protein [Clostridiales bacterium]